VCWQNIVLREFIRMGREGKVWRNCVLIADCVMLIL